MRVNLRQIDGNWEQGYALDKHTLSSTPAGHNDFGHMQFDTKRPAAGEALFQLKYRHDLRQARCWPAPWSRTSCPACRNSA